MKPILADLDLQELRSEPQAVLFLWVNWSIQARRSEHVVKTIVTEWREQETGCQVAYYRADLSDQKGEVWEAIRHWLKEEGRPLDSLTYIGNGALIWSREGQILAHLHYAGRLTSKELLNATRSVFECDPIESKEYRWSGE